MAIVSFISFSLFNYVGDPVDNMVGQEATMEDRLRIRQELGLEDPFVLQYVRFVRNALQGEFGISYRIKRPVAAVIVERIPATLELVFVSAIIALGVGIPLGVMTGIKRDSFASKAVLTVSLVGVSLPTFIIGIGLIYLFAVYLGWLPSSGRGGVVEFGWWKTSFLTVDGWRSIILPALTLSLFQLTMILRLVRAEMLEVMLTDYINLAGTRTAGAHHQFQPRVAQHAGSRDHHCGHQYRWPDRVFGHYGDRVPVARDGPDVHSGRGLCRYSHHGRLSLFCGARICDDQLYCRHCVFHDRPAVA